MKQIVAAGSVAFTHGAAGAGTLVFSGFTGFRRERLMAVSNVTRKTLIYAVEKTGKAGSWSSVTSSGGTLTLDTDTSTHDDTDTLRCIYEGAETPPVARGGNLWPIDLDTCTLASGNTRTTDYGDGPVPGSRSTRFVLAGDNSGANTGALTLVGRTDGALFGLRVWLKGSGAVEIRLRAVGASSGVTETVGSLVIASVPSSWTCYILRGYIAQFDCSSIQGEIRANGSGGTVEASEPDLRLLESATDFPEYQPPNGAAQTIIITKRVTISYGASGDSLTAGAGGISWHPELQRILPGCPASVKGWGGQYSDYIANHVLEDTDEMNLHRAYGVQILWMGQNNNSDPTTWEADIQRVIAALNHGRFLIVSFLNGDTSGSGSGPYPHIIEAFRRLKSRYGTKFVDLWTPMRGGTDYVLGCYRQDDVHPNWAGAGYIAHEIYKAMRRNGYLDGCIAGALDWGESADQESTHHLSVQTSVAAAVASTALLGMGRRHGFTIVNDSASASMYLALSGYASGSSFSVKLAPAERYELIGAGYHGPVYAQWTAAVGNARITEII